MNIYCIFFLAVLAVTEADLRSRNFSNIQPIEDFPLLQEKYPDVKYVGSLESSKIVGGNIAEPGQFPYQVFIPEIVQHKNHLSHYQNRSI